MARMYATWRERARRSLQEAYDKATAAGLEGKALEKALFDSYPFGERAYTPYKVWAIRNSVLRVHRYIVSLLRNCVLITA